MNWFKYSQKQLSLFNSTPLVEKEKKARPQVSIWGLSPSGVLTIIINGKQYEYYNITPHEENQLQSLLKNKNYSKFFKIINQLSNRQNIATPFKRTL